eukprot:496832-Prorocentrum_lima.AAC.1
MFKVATGNIRFLGQLVWSTTRVLRPFRARVGGIISSGTSQSARQSSPFCTLPLASLHCCR